MASFQASNSESKADTNASGEGQQRETDYIKLKVKDQVSEISRFVRLDVKNNQEEEGKKVD